MTTFEILGSCENEFVVIDNVDDAERVLGELNNLNLSEVCLNCDNLVMGSRAGNLTTVAISAVGINAISYVFDLTRIGKSNLPTGLKCLIESTTVRKIVYDCRTAADILFHQFQVILQNSLELHVLLQAIQMVKGTHCRQDLPTLEDIKHLYVNFGITEKLRADTCGLDHAAYQCLLVNYVYLGMKDFGLPVKMMERVEKGSAAYEGKFRNLDYDLSSSADFGVVVMKQDPI